MYLRCQTRCCQAGVGRSTPANRACKCRQAAAPAANTVPAHLKSPPGTESVGSCAASSVDFSRLAKPVQTCVRGGSKRGRHEGAAVRVGGVGGN